MCVVSMISDGYRKQFPEWFEPKYIQTRQLPDEETKALLREIIKKLDALDKKMGLKDCMDETKKKFFKIIELDEAELEELTADKEAGQTVKLPSRSISGGSLQTVKLTPGGTPFK